MIIIIKFKQKLDSKYYKKQQIRDNEIRKRAEVKLNSLTTYSYFELETAKKAVN